MAASAPDYYEIRWRVKNSGAAWSAPQRVHPCDEVVVEELDRTQLYEFEARAVSACGAKSVWVPSDYTVPGENAPLSVDTLTAQALADGVHLGWTSIAIPPAGIEYSVERSPDGATGWAERVRVRSTAYTDPETSGTTYYYRVRAVTFSGTFGPYSPVASSAGVSVSDLAAEAASAKSDADSALTQAQLANQELAAVANDNVLSPAEKPTVMRDYSVITAEQPGIDAQAAAYGIGAEKTDYDSAVTALTDYLATLTADTAWNDKSGNTTIVGATFRSNFNTVYTTRQTLLNAIYAAAKSKADTAKSAADAAAATANNAQPAAIVNPGFDQGMYGWTPESDASNWYAETGANGPTTGNTQYLVHHDSATTTFCRNAGRAPVAPGQVIKGGLLVRGVGSPTGTAVVRLLWQDVNGTDISATTSNSLVGNGVETLTVSGVAPANAAFCQINPGVGFATGNLGYYTFDNVWWNAQPSTLDEVPDSGSRFASVLAAAEQKALATPGANLIPNAIPSLNGAYWNLPGGSGYGSLYGEPNLYINTQTSPNTTVVTSANIPINGGTVSLSIDAFVNVNATNGACAADVQFFNSSGGFLGGSGLAFNLTTATSDFTRYVLNSIALPSGTSYATVRVYTSGFAGATTGGLYFRRIKLEIGATASPFNDDTTQFGNLLTLAGSGTQLGDQRNMPYVSWGNYGGGWSGMSVTYNTTTTSCTFNASAASYVGGGVSIPYNAGSVSVSGSAGSTVTYYLFYDDPSMTGGSKTLQATSDQITSLNARGRVLVGTVKVTYPTSGTGSGTGSGGCPDENAWVLRADPEGIRCDWTVRAKDIEVGHYLRLSDGRAGRVTYSQRKASPRIRVTSSDGHTLTCSPSAPLELAAGGHGDCVLARSSLSAIVRILCPVPVLATQIVNVEQMADGHVQHITCENACFWTGDDPDYLFAHHNLKPGGP